ncbi:glycoside hydrolase family 3 domain protein [Beutenbergia cavernae DSM 12333]|uniref:beta-glucosidase n=1 Tax=Beutenbergia cavernae (strain ATCC BAA-8 / DSM 12333 / CCUG 43141 / JCM 11478 / NBRC 16432 / NCIMB 13614 / HKI 0122) TaxID=471853 RepID=C5C2X5_BEUC1|nr:glycoside hydrolase family 3 N-terminal domain-containing protein [Beutenbergia cavernae]ACQ81819.1 glycoside hydrolase family 3 domain protein [Beutenbergia cavernae DSM 12333]
MTETAASRPWLDTSLDVRERAGLLLAAMTLEEKVGQLHQIPNADPVRDAEALAAGAIGTTLVASGEHAGNVRDAGTRARAVTGLQRAAVTTSRLGIPLIVARDVIHGHRTVFPIPLGQAASFDAGLVRDAARAAAVEASADGVRWTFAPMVDVTIDPRWGRVAEGYGESAWLTAHLGAAAVRGFQGDDLGRPDALVACAKHYVGYGLAQGGRDYAEVDVGPVTLHNRHLRPFAAAVDAGVGTVMTAFHTLDGTPMTAHRPLVREHLKGTLGFDGVVVSDWDAVGELLRHGVAADLGSATRLALGAGVDVDMVTGGYARHLAELVRSGHVPEALVDDAARRVLELKLRLGLFSSWEVDDARAATVQLAPPHRELARRAAASSLVLLENSGVLPLAAPRRVHVTGAFAQAREELFGTWTLDGRGEDVTTVEEALRERYPDAEITADDGRFPDRTLVAAREADVVVACVGEHPSRSGEANSVTSLDLPPGQTELLVALAGLGTPVVVVAVTGRPLALGRVASLADALLIAFHPGVEGGRGIVDVLSGDVPASGRLPMTLPRSVGQVPIHVGQLPTGRPIPAASDVVVGRYRDSSDLPAYPFGFGLGYADVAYGELDVVPLDGAADGAVLEAGVTVRNVGSRDAVETVQLYVRDHVAAVSRPLTELAGVVRVPLAAGAAERVTFRLDRGSLGYRDSSGALVVEPGEFTVRIGPHAGAGPSSTLSLEL